MRSSRHSEMCEVGVVRTGHPKHYHLINCAACDVRGDIGERARDSGVEGSGIIWKQMKSGAVDYVTGN